MMDKPTQLVLTSQANGAMVLSNDRTTITVQPDGTIVVASHDPIQLAGPSLSKLFDPSFDGPHGATSVTLVLKALARRTDR